MSTHSRFPLLEAACQFGPQLVWGMREQGEEQREIELLDAQQPHALHLPPLRQFLPRINTGPPIPRWKE